jgi:hypothetical protein
MNKTGREGTAASNRETASRQNGCQCKSAFGRFLPGVEMTAKGFTGLQAFLIRKITRTQRLFLVMSTKEASAEGFVYKFMDTPPILSLACT